MAIPSGSRSAQLYDVKVLAFPAASARTVQGLMQLFSLDQAAAERLIAAAPLLLTQQVSGQDAEVCAAELRKLGARAVVEPSAAHGGGLEEDLLPQPRAVPVANDTELEYDVLSSQEPGYVAHQSISTSLRAPMDLELGTGETDRMFEDKSSRRMQRQDELDLQTDDYGPGGPSLELAAALPSRQASPKAPAERTRPEPREPAKQETAARARVTAEGPSPHARAAVVARPATEESSTRTLALFQVCFALAVGAVGYWTDSSVIYGNAGMWSVLAHGVALYQLVLGLRELTS
jgi:hypothetical protein